MTYKDTKTQVQLETNGRTLPIASFPDNTVDNKCFVEQ